jgi:hypothetical protein
MVAEIAEDIMVGLCCAHCGVYFVKAHGHPVLCADCWPCAGDVDKKMHSKATEEEA